MSKTLPPFSISVSCIATPGLITLNPVEAQTNQQINTIVPNNKSFSFYYYGALLQIIDKIKGYGSGGSVFNNLNKTEFEKIEILDVNDEIKERYTRIVTPIFYKILSNEYQSHTLSTLRDTLLPKLMSGEIRINYEVRTIC